MIEFTISFYYDKQHRRARVMRSDTGKTIKYAVRPRDPFIVRRFGKQVTILKEEEEYSSNTYLNKDYTDFFNTLVYAIRLQDKAEYK